MKRRTLLGVLAGSGITANSGCISQIRENSSESMTSFELTDPEVPAEDSPEIDATGDGTVTVRGTVRYASSQCGTVRLAHSGYERSQDQLNVLVVAADGSDGAACTDDISEEGYRIEIDGEDRLRYVAVTEHHVFGDTHSTAADVTS